MLVTHGDDDLARRAVIIGVEDEARADGLLYGLAVDEVVTLDGHVGQSDLATYGHVAARIGGGNGNQFFDNGVVRPLRHGPLALLFLFGIVGVFALGKRGKVDVNCLFFTEGEDDVGVGHREAVTVHLLRIVVGVLVFGRFSVVPGGEFVLVVALAHPNVGVHGLVVLVVGEVDGALLGAGLPRGSLGHVDEPRRPLLILVFEIDIVNARLAFVTRALHGAVVDEHADVGRSILVDLNALGDVLSLFQRHIVGGDAHLGDVGNAAIVEGFFAGVSDAARIVSGLALEGVDAALRRAVVEDDIIGTRGRENGEPTVLFVGHAGTAPFAQMFASREVKAVGVDGVPPVAVVEVHGDAGLDGRLDEGDLDSVGLALVGDGDGLSARGGLVVGAQGKIGDGFGRFVRIGSGDGDVRFGDLRAHLEIGALILGRNAD